HKPVKITFPSNQVKKSKKEKEEEEDGEHETLEETLGIDSDVQIISTDEGDRKPENILYFKQVMNTFMVPFVLYVDFETFIQKDGDGVDKHEPSGFCCIRVSSFDFLNHEEAYVYSGPDVMS